MNKKQRTRSDEDDELFFGTSKGPLGFSVKIKQMHNFLVHINEEIKSPDYYSKVFDLLLEANEEDCVSFFIASPGGRVDGLNVLLEGLRMTEAYTVAILIGEAHSAASILALNCDEVIPTQSAEMLVHSCRFGTSGKAADIAAQTAHTLKTTEKLARQTYGQGFLTEDELSQMLDGKEFYFDSEQIQERLQRRVEFLEGPKEPEPKPARKRKSPVEA